MSATKENIAGLLSKATALLQGVGIDCARADAEWLLGDVLGLNRTELQLHRERTLLPEEAKKFHSYVARRLRREPLQYILGSQDFCDLHLNVAPGVFVPRPETELLVEYALEVLPLQGSRRVLELGTGSGAIPLALAAARLDLVIDSVERSHTTWLQAQENLRAAKVFDRVRFLKGDLFECAALQKQSYDLVISNPPYIPTGDLEQLAPEVRDFEPHLALDGGMDGLEVIRKLVAGAPTFLKAGGVLAFEMGDGQANSVVELCQRAGQWQNIQVKADLNGVPRFLFCRLQMQSS